MAFKGAYHGDTTGAMAVSDPEAGMHASLLASCRSITSSTCRKDDAVAAPLENAAAEARDTIAAIIVEPLVQGAGGMKFHDAGRASSAARSRRQIRCAPDFRRDVHRLWPYRDNVCLRAGRCRPDIITLSKALTGGTLPLAATVATAKCSTHSGRTIRRRH